MGALPASLSLENTLPYSDPDVRLCRSLPRVLMDLPSDDFDDLLGLYQEVWIADRRQGSDT